jgi:ABC-type phosphate transport system substrate-binding protein
MALAIADESGSPIEPKPAEIAAGKYPLSRPVFAVVGDKPTRNTKKLLDFLLSEKGQALVAASDLVPVGVKKVP